MTKEPAVWLSEAFELALYVSRRSLLSSPLPPPPAYSLTGQRAIPLGSQALQFGGVWRASYFIEMPRTQM